jgi:hypothetical protein
MVTLVLNAKHGSHPQATILTSQACGILLSLHLLGIATRIYAPREDSSNASCFLGLLGASSIFSQSIYLPNKASDGGYQQTKVSWFQ